MENVSLLAIFTEIAIQLCRNIAESGRFYKLPRTQIKKREPTAVLSSSEKSLISVIIPTYNEEKTIAVTLDSVLNNNNHHSDDVEVFVSDGGSKDKTLEICKLAYPRAVVLANSGTCRAECQNNGARAATGDILLFLHADSVLPENWRTEVRRAAADDQFIVGCFSFKLTRPSSSEGTIITSTWSHFCLYLIELGTNIRSKFLCFPYGDQGLFFRRNDFFHAVGGFPVLPFMEDFELISSIRSSKQGKIVTLPSAIETSARRWEKTGYLYNTFLNQLIIFGRSIGIPHSRLVIWYYGLTKKKSY